MNNDIGVMQGRLLPKYKDKYQAHPFGYWQDEFYIAKDLGLDCIEFILDYENAELNPLIKKEGINEIIKVVDQSGITVKSICADYFMEAPLHSKDNKVSYSSQKVLNELLNNVSELGVENVVIPCVDKSSLSSEIDIKKFIEYLYPSVKIAENYNINLSLETDLNPKSFLKLIQSFNSDKVTVNYDIGNSAYLGYDLVEELNHYGKHITDIHIKDRILGGGSVELGEGDADFEKFFMKLKEFNYKGPFILQAYRDDEGVEIFKKQLDWVKKYFYE